MYKKMMVVFSLIALALVFCASSRAQSTQGTILGLIRDANGRVVPGVQVTATNEETGVKLTIKTDARGLYSFHALAIGTYDVEASTAGFKAAVRSGLLLTVNDVLQVDITLQVGSDAEQVTVTADAVHAETVSTQMGEVISGKTMTAMPLVSRSYTDLLALQPGVSPTSSGFAGGQGGAFSATGFTITPVSGSLNAGNQSVNGQREASNGFLLNGTTVEEFAFSGAGIIPNLDSIAEFRILTNNFDAEYGNYSGGQINVITKSGTNTFHGSVFEFLRNAAFDAKNYFATTRDDHKENQFGGTIGGPIKHDKLFFFGDYQGDRVIIGQSALGRIPVPSDAERQGNFSAPALASVLSGTVRGSFWAQQLSNSLGYTVSQGEPYYFAGCSSAQCVFPGAQIPASVITVPSRNLLAYVPPANTVDGTGNSFFTPGSGPERLSDDKGSGRIDFNSRLGLITGYYFFDQYLESVPNLLLPGFGDNFTGRSQVVNIGDTKTLGNSTINEAHFGFTRLKYEIHIPTGGGVVTPGSLGFAEGANTLGISPSIPQYARIPNMDFNAFSFGASGGPLGITENTAQVSDNFSKIIRAHTLTFGGQFHYNQLAEYNLGSNGSFGFDGGETGVDFADFLIGAPTSYSQSQIYPSYGRSRSFGLFAQDSWHAMSNLTLNYGLRWDVSRPWSELHNELETLVPGLQSQVFPGAPVGWVFPGDPGIPSTLAPTRYNNLAPRVGLAYSPSAAGGFLKKLTGEPGKSSIRAAWGRFYSSFEGATNFNAVGDAPFGNYYGSPVPPEFVTPFVDRGTGNVEGQRFPSPPPPANSSRSHPDTSINWANYLPIGTSPGFWYKNVLPYTEQYELSLQRQLSASMVFTMSYVGAQGHHLLSSVEANPGNPALCLSVSQPGQVIPGTSTCGPNGENGVYSPVAGGTINGTRAPFGENFGSDGLFMTNGKSNYNSLQLSLQQRLPHLEYLAGYTYSKSLDNASGYGEQINILNPEQNALSAFNATHNFVVSYNYDLPFYLIPGPSRLTKGWKWTGITRFATGQPVTLYEIDDRSLLGTGSAGAISVPLDRPNYTPGSLHFSNPRSGKPYFNTALFSPETLGQLGTSSRRFFGGPGINNWDTALLKDTAIKEGINLEFRAELFNALNHAQFGAPDGNFNDSTFGLVNTANSPRIMQLSLKLLF
ncbi:TonB-dependent receptor domain-containing protein [Acidicapsa ligni]|uniref:TonB-dependent receptor domain-containing protein n=1 Tax=Acidicapsa ligni TaxID=542300 RepID=UPI0021DFF5F1|nr:TonB-dependent receptor [Acidicapsa ligni]